MLEVKLEGASWKHFGEQSSSGVGRALAPRKLGLWQASAWESWGASSGWPSGVLSRSSLAVGLAMLRPYSCGGLPSALPASHTCAPGWLLTGGVWGLSPFPRGPCGGRDRRSGARGSTSRACPGWALRGSLAWVVLLLGGLYSWGGWEGRPRPPAPWLGCKSLVAAGGGALRGRSPGMAPGPGR